MNATMEQGLEGFNLLEVSMKNLNKYGSKTTTISFDKQFIAILGPTGAGKSSILDALTFAIYRRTSRTDIGMKITEVVHDNGYAQIKFNLNGILYEIERGVQGKKNETYVNLKINGEPFKGTIPEKDKQIREIIGLDYEGFRCSSFIRQDEIKYFSRLTPSERLEKLQHLFRLDIFNKAQEMVKVRKDERENEKVKMETTILGLKEQMKKIPQLKNEIKSLQSQLKDIQLRLDQLSIEKIQLDNDLIGLAPFYMEHENLLSEVERIKKEIAENTGKIKEFQKDQERYEKGKEKLKQLEQELEKLILLEREFRDLEKNFNEKHALVKRRAIYETDLTSKGEKFSKNIRQLESECKGTKQRLKEIATSIDKEAAFSLLNEEGRHEERIERITHVELNLAEKLANNSLISQFKEELTSSSKGLELIRTKKNSITGDSFLLTELKTQLKKTEAQIDALKTEYQSEKEKVKIEIKKIDDEINELKISETDKQRIKSLKQEIDDLTGKKQGYETLKRNIEQLTDKSSLIIHLQETIRVATDTLREKTGKINELRPKVSQYSKLSIREDDLIETIKQVSEQKSVVDTTITLNRNRIAELDEVKKQIGDKEELLDTLNKELGVLQILYDNVFHKKGITLFAINKMLPHISKKASIILMDITDKRFKNLQLNETISGKSYGFDIVVEDRGALRDASSYSGGEKTQINAAIRLAISEQLSEIPAISEGRRVVIHTLFIDEGDIGSLDPTRARGLFIQKIFSLQNKFKKIILITQFPDIVEQFDKIIQVTTTPYGESQIVK